MCLVMYCLVPERKYYVSIDLIWIGGCDFHEDLLGSLSNQRPPRCCQRGRLLCAATINLCHSSGFIKSCSYHEKCSAATQLFSPCPQGVFFSRPLCKASTNQPQRWLRRSVLCFYLSSRAGPQSQKWSDQQITLNPTGSIHKKARKKKFDPKKVDFD